MFWTTCIMVTQHTSDILAAELPSSGESKHFFPITDTANDKLRDLRIPLKMKIKQ